MPTVRLVAVEDASGVRCDAVTAAKPRKFFRGNVIANHRILEIGAPIDVYRAGDMPGIVKQNVLIRFDDPDPIILEMFLEPVSLHQRFWMRVLIVSHTTGNFCLLACAGKRIPQHVLA